MRRNIPTLACLTIVGCLVAAESRAQVVRQDVEGIRNFAKIESTVACAGAISPAAIQEIKKMGYASIINLREASEAGADIDAEAAAAKTAGITFIHLPFNTASPNPAVVDSFLKAVTDAKNQPAFVHCASGNRAAAMWMIKRMLVDKWDAERAGTEAAALGLTSGALKTFALQYVETHRN